MLLAAVSMKIPVTSTVADCAPALLDTYTYTYTFTYTYTYTSTRTFLSRDGVPVLTAAGLLTCRSCGTSISSHMPLLRSKLKSVAVGEDDVITSSASNFCRASWVAREVAPYANSRTCLASLGGVYFCNSFASDPSLSTSCPSYKRLALEIQSLPFSMQRPFRVPRQQSQGAPSYWPRTSSNRKRVHM